MIGGKIVEARRKIYISQAQLAERLFISPQAVGKWERGESIPDLITFNRLAKILGVDLNYFSEDFRSASRETTSLEPSVTKAAETISEKRKKNPGWDMSRVDWVGADFSGLKNLKEKFSSSNMQRCKFTGSDMAGLLLKNNNVDTCDFSGSDFSNSHIQRSNLNKNNFKGCSMNGAEFSESYFSGCDFSGADLTGAVAKSGGFEKCILVNTVMNHTFFMDTYLADIVFNGLVEDCSFENSSFSRVKFQNARFINCFFKNNKNLKRVKFIDCQADRMTYAFLKNGKADLTGISLITE